MRIKVVVVDDDYSALRAIKNYCEQIELEVIEAFDSPAKFVDSIDKLNFELAILDYAMPQFNGIQLAEILNSYNIPVIFVTGHRDEIASVAWDLNCIACIEKPVNIEKIKTAINRYSKSSKPTGGTISFDIYGGSVLNIKLSEIAYFGSCPDDTSGNDKILCTTSGKTHRLVSKKLESIMQMLPEKDFMRIGRFHIVAKEAIQIHTKNFEELTLKVAYKQLPIKLSVSPSIKDAFKKWFQTN